MSEFRIREEKPYYADIYMAGDIAKAKDICRQHCMEVGLCVTVTEADFIYTGGSEMGIRVGLINYPRFPSAPEEVFTKALMLAEKLAVGMCQWSALVQGPDRVVWLTRRSSINMPSTHAKESE